MTIKPLFDKIVVEAVESQEKTAGGIFQALGVEIRAESDDSAVFRGVGLQTLKDGLSVLQDACAFVENDICVRCQRTLVPGSVSVI